jgi:GAF domain-containing protein
LTVAKDVYAAIARVLIPMHAEMYILDIVESDGRIQRIEMLHADPAAQHFVRDPARHYPVTSHHPVHEVAASRKPIFWATVDETTLGRMATDDAHFAVLRRYGPRSFMSIPLESKGRTVAIFSCAITSANRTFTQADFAFACQLGSRASAALEAIELGGRAMIVSDAAPPPRGPKIRSSGLHPARKRR